MEHPSHDLFLLTTSLSQLKSRSELIHLFTESIKNIFSGSKFSWHTEKENAPTPNFPVCTRTRTYGYIHFDKSLQRDQESYALLQNATQLLAIMLERLVMEELLSDQKVHLQDLVNEKTREYAALNEEYQVINEELIEGTRNLQQINDQLTMEVNERKLAEEALKKNQILLCETERMAKMGGWEFDVNTLTQTWTEETFRILEIDPGEGTPVVPEGLTFITPAHRPDAERAIQRAIEFGEPYDREWEIITTKGNHRWVRAKAMANQIKGRTVSVSGSFQDITELKKAERLLRDIIDKNPMSIQVIDLNGHTLMVNDAHTKLFGTKPTPDYSVFDDFQVEQQGLGDLMKRARNGEVVHFPELQYNVHLINPAFRDVPIWIRVVIFPVEGDDGKPESFVLMHENVTERKMALEEINKKNEQLLEVNAEKDKFFSILAHDLRSPFTSFLGFTQIMTDELYTLTLDQIQKIAMGMRKSATNLYSLLDNLLEWSRLQRGVTGFHPESFALMPKMFECIEPMCESASKKEVEVKCEIPADILVFADLHMVQTIVRNLVSNAIKYSRKGGKVKITAIKMNQSVEICVKDNGIGMDNDMIDKLFRFDQNTNRPGTENEPSTGLGLIICKEFVEKHGGKIWVRSEEGKGSTFSFSLPGNDVSSASDN